MRAGKTDLSHPENIYIYYSIGMFFFAQLFYYLIHAGFHSSFFGIDFMMVDINAITAVKGHFWQSMFYYHLSPPLYVLYASVFYLLFPPNGELGFYILHSVLGVYAIYCLYKVQRKLDINPILATFLITIFVMSPTFNLTETTAFYDFPVACLMIISTWRLVKLLENPNFLNGFIFFFVIALICSIRSLYHVILYMTPLIFITLFMVKNNWKIILLSSLLPFLLVFSPYLKNYILFGEFTTSTYFGETLDSIAMQFTVSLPQREEGIKKGFFSDLALCPSVADGIEGTTPTSKLGGWYCYSTFVNKYRDAYVHRLGKNYSDIPLLSCEPQQTKFPGVLFPRRSCLGNIGMSKEYEKNALQAMIHYPASYWSGIQSAMRQYFNTGVSNFYEIMGNSRQLPTSLTMSWLRLPLMSLPDPKLAISLPFLVLFPLLLFFGTSYLFYSQKIIFYLLAIYSLAFFVTVHEAEKYIALSQFLPILQNWGLQSSLISWLLAMLSIMILSVITLRCLISIYNYFFNSTQMIFMNSTKRIVVFYLLSNIIFTSHIITLLVGFAQQRYRFYVDGLYLVLFGLFTQTVILPIVSKLWQICMSYNTFEKKLFN